jgi:hypothetical protein
MVTTNYLGKDSILNIFLEKTVSYSKGFARALKFLERNPQVFINLIERLENHPQVKAFIKDHDINEVEFTNYANQLKNNPNKLAEEIKKVQPYLPLDGSTSTANLNDTNPLAILILVIALLPLLITLAVLIATITIITCLNIGGCFESLFEALVVGFFQGLTPA